MAEEKHETFSVPDKVSEAIECGAAVCFIASVTTARWICYRIGTTLACHGATRTCVASDCRAAQRLENASEYIDTAWTALSLSLAVVLLGLYPLLFAKGVRVARIIRQIFMTTTVVLAAFSISRLSDTFNSLNEGDLVLTHEWGFALWIVGILLIVMDILCIQLTVFNWLMDRYHTRTYTGL